MTEQRRDHLMESLGSNICEPCMGLGNQFAVVDGVYTWAICLACGGRGARVAEQTGTIPVRTGKKRVDHEQEAN